jgi:hypothetical protein
VLPEVQNDDQFDCFLLLWRGHKPLPGKPSRMAEKAGTLAHLAVQSRDFHEPDSNNVFINQLVFTTIEIKESYIPFATSTFGAESVLAGTGITPGSFRVVGLWWSLHESAEVQIYLGQYHKSRPQLEHELTAIAARVVPAFGL